MSVREFDVYCVPAASVPERSLHRTRVAKVTKKSARVSLKDYLVVT